MRVTYIHTYIHTYIPIERVSSIYSFILYICVYSHIENPSEVKESFEVSKNEWMIQGSLARKIPGHRKTLFHLWKIKRGQTKHEAEAYGLCKYPLWTVKVRIYSNQPHAIIPMNAFKNTISIPNVSVKSSHLFFGPPISVHFDAPTQCRCKKQGPQNRMAKEKEGRTSIWGRYGF